MLEFVFFFVISKSNLGNSLAYGTPSFRYKWEREKMLSISATILHYYSATILHQNSHEGDAYYSGPFFPDSPVSSYFLIQKFTIIMVCLVKKPFVTNGWSVHRTPGWEEEPILVTKYYQKEEVNVFICHIDSFPAKNTHYGKIKMHLGRGTLGIRTECSNFILSRAPEDSCNLFLKILKKN